MFAATPKLDDGATFRAGTQLEDLDIDELDLDLPTATQLSQLPGVIAVNVSARRGGKRGFPLLQTQPTEEVVGLTPLGAHDTQHRIDRGFLTHAITQALWTLVDITTLGAEVLRDSKLQLFQFCGRGTPVALDDIKRPLHSTQGTPNLRLLVGTDL